MIPQTGCERTWATDVWIDGCMEGRMDLPKPSTLPLHLAEYYYLHPLAEES